MKQRLADMGISVAPRVDCRTIGLRLLDVFNSEDSKENQYVMDARDVRMYVNNQPFTWSVKDIGFDSYILLLVSEKMRPLECPYGWESKKIGCLDRTAWNIARAVAGGYAMTNQVSMTQIDPFAVHDRNSIEKLVEQYDIVVAAVSEGTRLSRMIRRARVRVMGVGDVIEDRVRAFYPDTKLVKTTLYGKILPMSGTSSSEKGNMVVTLRVRKSLVDRLIENPTETTNTEAFQVKYNFREPKYISDPRYRCFRDNGETTTKDNYYECVSKRNVLGNEVEPGTWDRPCEVDTDCPWQPYGGECQVNTGYCSVPIGVKRISYRQTFHDTTYHRPFRKWDSSFMFHSDIGGFIHRFDTPNDP